MKKSEREVYRVLANEIDSLICDFCKYAVSITGASPCDCGEPYCDHPLKDRISDYGSHGGFEPLDDCWGFRPRYSVDLCADIVGIVLAKGWCNGYYIWQNKKSIWKMAPMEI